MMLNSGIYKITSPSGKIYIGSAKDFDYRWSKHSYDLRKQNHHCKPLQSACQKYGFENLTFSKLLICKPEDLLFYEQRALDRYKPAYNICKIAGSALGVKRTPEVRAKMIASRTPEVRLAISIGNTGKLRNAETCKRLSESLKISLGTPEARAINSLRQKLVQNLPERIKANSEQQKISQMRPEVRAKKGRALICVENGLKFTNGHEAAEWCHLATLTTNKNAFVAINKAVRTGKPIYGFHWKAIEKDGVK